MPHRRAAAVKAEIGRRIRAARRAAGMTQEVAAAATDTIDTRYWQRLERGSANPTVETLDKMAAALRISFWQLLALPEPRHERGTELLLVADSGAAGPRARRPRSTRAR